VSAVTPPSAPVRVPVLGHLVAYHRDPLGFLNRITRDHGDVVRFRLGHQDVFVVNDPGLIKAVLHAPPGTYVKGRAMQQAKRLVGEGLLTSEGDFHLRQRRLCEPAFHRARLAAYSTAMVDYAEQVGLAWRDGETVDIGLEMTNLSQVIVATTLFSADIQAETDQIAEAMTNCAVFLNSIMLPFLDHLAKVPVPATQRFRLAKEHLEGLIDRLIDECRATGTDRGDLLSMLLTSRDRYGCGMTDQQVHDEVITIFLAGHETLASALTWTWFLLSRHPRAEQTLHSELDTVLVGRKPLFDDIPRLPYTRMVLAEALRLYPPAWAIARRALCDVEIGKYSLPAGSIVVLSQYLTQRDGRYFTDPNVFDPQRWRPDAERRAQRFGYFPFGSGIRRCIGESFAWTESILVLAALARNWRLRLAADQAVDANALVTLRPRRAIRMTAERRVRTR
jgi:cytochrome P450